ncbi:hypothetical protein EUTSA_v10026862mg [Eutrema salsugineum]|uniref:GTD-binding domain-containing protein n=1 Tax=Eutrema salsugineum TaxID=72664 RepID=V4P9Q7_EUTSA|nr:myosin-binding protein 3 [Eutrema salsugineum]ESQ56416.1 hypothetical protein EUTSA_v10026862mg [Eutrema salsugineum]
MDYPENYSLTFSGILVAFLELAFAYCLLCVSAFVLIASKFLVYLPCPCSGFLEYQNVHKLLIDWPFEIILIIQKMAVTTRTRIRHHQEQEERTNSVDKDKILELMNKVRLLEEVVQAEKLARAALIVELEEERAASASAADEAMAMILRLQAEKASLEMEGKQYERMIEEKFAYDEEEMNILKEILFKREREKHFLEKELETYKHTDEDDPEVDDREQIVYDVHVIEDENDAKKKDDDASEHKEREADDQLKQMENMSKDHDSSASSPSSSSPYFS